MRAILLGYLALIAGASPAQGQTWRELYERGEFERAATLLHPIVLGPPSAPDMPHQDIDATAALARMYLSGKGVERDRVLACSLANSAMAAAVFRYYTALHPAVAPMARLEAETCKGLTADEREEVGRLSGCLKFAPVPQRYDLDRDHSLEISRRGLRVQYGTTQAVHPLPSYGCSQRVALVRYTRVESPAPDDDIAPRHLIEVFTWTPTGPPWLEQQTLVWNLGEIIGAGVEWRTAEQLGNQPGSPWRPTPVPEEIGPVTLEMGSDGEVRWRLGFLSRTGLLEPLPEAASDDVAPLPTTGTAQLNVSVVDRFEVPLKGATVRLNGVVSQEATVNEAGFALFENLPDGRYDVVAQDGKMAGSAPRVIDLTGSVVTEERIVLKPMGPTSTMTVACGGFDARSVRTLGQNADVVLHVKVTGQKTVEDRSRSRYSPRDLVTFTEAQVMESLKRAPLEPSRGATLTLRQSGGRMDRGEHVDVHTFNNLPPLNVGDEYVVFVKFDEKGTAWIHGAEDGAFRIRNGRVEPLGRGSAATAWRGRSTSRFLETIETTVNRSSRR